MMESKKNKNYTGLHAWPLSTTLSSIEAFHYRMKVISRKNIVIICNSIKKNPNGIVSLDW